MDKSTRRRLLIWAGAGLAALALVALALWPSPEMADFGSVARGDLEVTVQHEGKTRVRDRYVVSAPLAGRVLRIELEPGDPVEAGETALAAFRPSEPTPLDARARAEAEAGVRAARAALEQARAERERARAEQVFAAAELERVRRLAADGIASRQALDSAEAEAEAHAEALAAADAALESARHQLERAGAQLLEPGEESDAGGTVLTLRSPIDGVVIRRLRESEAVVPAGEPLLEVADPADLEVVADFLSADAVRVRPGMPAWIDRWGGDEPLPAHVRRVEPGGFLKVSALGVEEQRVNVILDFDDAEDARTLGDAYRVEARVVVDRRSDVLTVPVSALFREGEGWAAFAVEDGRARIREIEVGARNNLRAEVIGGLAEGDTVIVHPADEISDGTRVEEAGGEG